MAPDDFADWFRLLQAPGVGRDTARRLLAACGSPGAVLRTPAATLRTLAGQAAAEALTGEPPAPFEQRLAAALAWLDAGDDRHVVTLADPAYPPALLQTADPPLLLYVHGRLQLLRQPALAIVGSRHPTAQGRDNARAFARALAERGYVVVSGLARGIDGAAHEGALLAAEAGGLPAGVTIAVVGTGLDSVYPTAHRELAARIAAAGAVVSEYPPGVPPLAEHFPQRNRIIAGLTLGTLVVEAAMPSGSLITARLASEAGREVFAIPGSIHAPQSKGCHALIKQGAKLVESAADVIDELRGMAGRTRALPFGDDAAGAGAAEPLGPGADAADAHAADPRFAALLDALGHDPVTLDALLARTGWPAAELNARLRELELEDRVARLPGGLFQRRHTG
jgi:DNA processing protein